MILILKIPGIPQPKQSARFRIAKNKAGNQFIQKYQAGEILAKEDSIAFLILSQLPKGFIPFEKGIAIRKLHFVFPPVTSLNKREKTLISQGGLVNKTTKPDIDNLQKLTWDALQGVVFLNDSQICQMDNVGKYYGNQPCIIVEIEHLTNESNLLFNN